MSLLTALKGFGGWVAREWTKIYNAAPAIEKVADAVLSYAAPALQIVLGKLDPEAAAIVGPILAEVQKDISVVSGLIFDFGATPHAANILSSIGGNLQGLLDAGHIKDANLVGKVTGIVKTVTTLTEALLSAIAPAAAA